MWGRIAAVLVALLMAMSVGDVGIAGGFIPRPDSCAVADNLQPRKVDWLRADHFEQSYWLGRLQQVIFNRKDPTALTKLPHQLGLTLKWHRRDKRSGSEAAIYLDEGVQIVLWNGTGSLKDALVDATYWQLPLNAAGMKFHGLVHKGFNYQVTALYGDIKDQLKPEIPTIMYGHSLGGACTALAAYKLHADGYEINRVHLAANPLPGDATFVKLFTEELGERTYRYSFDEDLVTKVPPAQEVELAAKDILGVTKLLAKWQFKLIDYAHVGRWYRFDRSLVPVGPGAWSGNLDESFWRTHATNGYRNPQYWLNYAKGLGLAHDIGNYYCASYNGMVASKIHPK